VRATRNLADLDFAAHYFLLKAGTADAIKSQVGVLPVPMSRQQVLVDERTGASEDKPTGCNCAHGHGDARSLAGLSSVLSKLAGGV
jgi:hypothetical protein